MTYAFLLLLATRRYTEVKPDRVTLVGLVPVESVFEALSMGKHTTLVRYDTNQLLSELVERELSKFRKWADVHFFTLPLHFSSRIHIAPALPLTA